MEKWEYQSYVRTFNFINEELSILSTDKFRNVLDEYGEKGWELISSNKLFEKNTDTHHLLDVEYWFKRKMK